MFRSVLVLAVAGILLLHGEGMPFKEKINGYWDTIIHNFSETNKGMARRLDGPVGKKTAKQLGKKAKGMYRLRPKIAEAGSVSTHEMMYYIDKMTRLLWTIDELGTIATEATTSSVELMEMRLKSMERQRIGAEMHRKAYGPVERQIKNDAKEKKGGGE